jgi:hypothetical protein
VMYWNSRSRCRRAATPPPYCTNSARRRRLAGLTEKGDGGN